MAKPKPDQPSSTLIFLVRHGKTPTTGDILPGRAPGLFLSDVGIGQAEKVGDRLAGLDGEPISAVYASPLERTMQTAEHLAKNLGANIVENAGLLEADFGSWTGRKLSELRKLDEWRQVQRRPSGFRFPDGESFGEMQLRITDTISQLAGKHPGERIVCVSHADPIKAAVAHAVGTHLDLFQRIVVGPCSVSAISYSKTDTVVLCVNSSGDDLNTLKPS